MTIKVGVIGAAGFAGIEAVRLCLLHPDFEPVVATSDELAGKKISETYPAFKGMTDLVFTTHENAPLNDCEVVFLAVPHTAALAEAPSLVKKGKVVIDLSADFRLKDPAIYEKWYGVSHTERDLLAQAAFGLPELFKAELESLAQQHESGEGVLVGCAGCYPTATSLAAYPAIHAGLLGDGPVIADAISGVSGAGKKASQRTHFCFADEDLQAYSVASHRHTPEIEQILGIEGRLVFTPHLAPLDRGLLSTVTLPVAAQCSQAQLDEIYSSTYEADELVSVLVNGEQPRTSAVAGTSRAHVAAVYNERTSTIIATCAIDNVGKGAAGQGVQCANIVCGLPETAGLQAIASPF